MQKLNWGIHSDSPTNPLNNKIEHNKQNQGWEKIFSLTKIIIQHTIWGLGSTSLPKTKHPV